MIGASLRYFIARRNIEAANIVRGKTMPLSRFPMDDIEQLQSDDSGDMLPLFILGAHNPDDTTDRWVA